MEMWKWDSSLELVFVNLSTFQFVNFSTYPKMAMPVNYLM
jgi:hypothetical protein